MKTLLSRSIYHLIAKPQLTSPIVPRRGHGIYPTLNVVVAGPRVWSPMEGLRGCDGGAWVGRG